MTGQGVDIACTLGAGDYKARMAWLADLNGRALTAHQLDGLTLRLQYRPDALEDVQELVRRETACCGFLTFDLQSSPRAVELAITAPPQAEVAAKSLFNDFISGAVSGCASSCACA